MTRLFAFTLICAALLAPTAAADEVALTCGSATIAFDLPVLLGETPLNQLDAVFGITETRDQLLSLPGNNPSPVITWELNLPGTPSPTGRLIQATTLVISHDNVLGTWQPGNDVGPFLSGGEQIGFGGMTRFTLDPGINGILLFGDWALRYAPGRADGLRSGLVLTSNIDFPSAVFADIGSASITANEDQITINGDVLVSDGLIVLGFPPSNYLLDIGNFSLTARLASSFPPGDINHDSIIDAADVQIFVDVLIGVDVDNVHRIRCDFNCDGKADGRDIKDFLHLIL